MDRSLLRGFWHIGERLAEKLLDLSASPDLLILGVPGDGMMMAAAIAERLGAPLDVFLPQMLPDIAQQTVVLVDDGLGVSQMVQRLGCLRESAPLLLVLAVPMVAPEDERLLRGAADVVVAAITQKSMTIAM